jgi:hypothetical protein
MQRRMWAKIRTLKTLRKPQGKPQGAAPTTQDPPSKGEGGAPEEKKGEKETRRRS